MTSTWTFFGKVHPERVAATCETPFVGVSTSPTLGLKMKTRLTMHSGQVIVELSLLEGSEPDLLTLRNLAAQEASSITDLIGYIKGYHLSVEIVSAVRNDTEVQHVFDIGVPSLVQRRIGQPQTMSKEVLKAVGKSPFAQGVLQDFQSAMRDPAGTGFYCYRAIEAMMQSFRPVEGGRNDRETAWEQLRAALRVDRTAIDVVRQHAAMSRHGEPSGLSDAARALIFQITDELIGRFLRFVVADRVPLPEAEFPLLTQ